ncbi:hypothetical protein ACGFII_07750 [Micromonospora chalcea]
MFQSQVAATSELVRLISEEGRGSGSAPRCFRSLAFRHRERAADLAVRGNSGRLILARHVAGRKAPPMVRLGHVALRVIS